MLEDHFEDPTRQLFDTDHEWGRLTALVLEEHEKEESELARDEAVQLYIKAGCASAIFLLDWMERHPKVECVSTSDHNGSLCFGLPEHGISPVLWLLYLAARIHELSEADREMFEESCSYLALTREARDISKRRHMAH